MKRYLAIAGILVLMAGSAVLFASQQYQRFLATPLSLPVEAYVLQVEPGTSGSSIIKHLAGSGFTRDSWQWKLLMRVPSFITEKDVLAAASSSQTIVGKEIKLEIGRASCRERV